MYKCTVFPHIKASPELTLVLIKRLYNTSCSNNKRLTLIKRQGCGQHVTPTYLKLNDERQKEVFKEKHMSYNVVFKLRAVEVAEKKAKELRPTCG